MVTFQNAGRLGNFLFEAAAMLAYAWDHDLEYSAPSESRDPKWHPVYMPYLVHPGFEPYGRLIVIKEVGMPYQELPFNEDWRGSNIQLQGYFQSEKYFKKYRERILAAFRLRPAEYLTGMVAVHIRRGDYLTIYKNGVPKHPPVSSDWIRAQIEKFPGYAFLFFSDDIEWCKKEYRDLPRCGFSEGRNEFEDLRLMSSCEHQICSASTFSWWAAWLNEHTSKRIIIPKQWFSPGWGGHDTRDIVPSEWEKV